MYRLLVIARHTFFECIVQPIYSLLLVLGIAILGLFALLPFFTLGEDTIMFKSVALDVTLLVVLLGTLFATSRSIYEEIEDRTMLTLMSKPVQRWQVLVGKYVGVVAAALLMALALGGVLAICLWWRLPSDYSIRSFTLDVNETRRLWEYRLMHLAGLLPAVLLIWLQVSVLAAISVALSTRFSLVVNLPTVVLLYVAGNLTRFLFPLSGPEAPLGERSAIVRGLAYVGSLILPYLESFDLRQYTVYSPIALAGTRFVDNPLAVSYGLIWNHFAVAAVYAVAYAVFALAVGMWLFETRDLGGAEG